MLLKEDYKYTNILRSFNLTCVGTKIQEGWGRQSHEPRKQTPETSIYWSAVSIFYTTFGPMGIDTGSGVANHWHKGEVSGCQHLRGLPLTLVKQPPPFSKPILCDCSCFSRDMITCPIIPRINGYIWRIDISRERRVLHLRIQGLLGPSILYHTVFQWICILLLLEQYGSLPHHHPGPIQELYHLHPWSLHIK